MTGHSIPHDILVAPEDEARSSRYAALTSCITLALAVVVALVAWHAFAGNPAQDTNRKAAQPLAAQLAATAVPAVQPAADAASAGQPSASVAANAPAAGPPLVLRAVAQVDPQASAGTLTVFVVDTAEQATELEQGLLATNAIRATGGAAPLRATVVSAAADPEGFWLALARSENEPFFVVDLRQP